MSTYPYSHELLVPAGPEPSTPAIDQYIRGYLAQTLKDPDSLKQYQLRYVTRTRWIRGLVNGGGSEEGWLACFEYNAKNSYGGYVGLQVDGLIFRAGPDGQPYVVPGAMQQIHLPKC